MFMFVKIIIVKAHGAESLIENIEFCIESVNTTGFKNSILSYNQSTNVPKKSHMYVTTYI